LSLPDTARLAPLTARLPEGLNPTLQEVAEQLYLYLVEEAGLRRNPAEIADIALGQVDRLARVVGGSGFYMPKGIAVALCARDKEIAAKFKGNNTRELAREYGVSEMRITQIIKAWRQAELAKRQGAMF
jgi:Mor family transcriptional regulator